MSENGRFEKCPLNISSNSGVCGLLESIAGRVFDSGQSSETTPRGTPTISCMQRAAYNNASPSPRALPLRDLNPNLFNQRLPTPSFLRRLSATVQSSLSPPGSFGASRARRRRSLTPPTTTSDTICQRHKTVIDEVMEVLVRWTNQPNCLSRETRLRGMTMAPWQRTPSS